MTQNLFYQRVALSLESGEVHYPILAKAARGKVALGAHPTELAERGTPGLTEETEFEIGEVGVSRHHGGDVTTPRG
jgi:hypothetical protein